MNKPFYLTYHKEKQVNKPFYLILCANLGLWTGCAVSYVIRGNLYYAAWTCFAISSFCVGLLFIYNEKKI